MTKLKFLIGITLLLLCQTVFGQRSVSIDVNGVLQGTTSQALFTANSNLLNRALSLMSITNTDTARTLLVASNGNDSLGIRGRQDRPFLTITAAKNAATNGDWIKILPGEYLATNILKRGVNYELSGAILTNNGSYGANSDIVDDRLTGATTNLITGDGEFRLLLETNQLTTFSTGAFTVTNRLSKVVVKGRKVQVRGFYQTGQLAALNVRDGLLVVQMSEEISDPDIDRQSFDPSDPETEIFSNVSAIYWERGDVHLTVPIIRLESGYIAWGEEPSGGATNELFINADLAKTVKGNCYYMAGESDNYIMWLKVLRSESTESSVITTVAGASGGGKLYLEGFEKISGGAIGPVVGNDGMKLWLTGQKITTTSTQPTVGVTAGENYITVQHYESTGPMNHNPLISIGGGTNHFFGGYAVATNGFGVRFGGKTSVSELVGMTIQTVNSSGSGNTNEPVLVNTNGATLFNCRLIAPSSSVSSIKATNTINPVAIAGTLQANSDKGSSVVFSSGIFIVNTNTYLAGPLTMSTSGNVPVPPSGSYSLFYSNNTVYVLKATGGPVDLEAGGGGLSDGDKGDVTVSGSGSAWAVTKLTGVAGLVSAGAGGVTYLGSTNVPFSNVVSVKLTLPVSGNFIDPPGGFINLVNSNNTVYAMKATGMVNLEGGGADAAAIHGNASGEIAAITAKGTPVGADFLLIEDSAASNAKKSATLSSLFTDALIPNTITVDLATVATTANAGDSATSFFPSGTLEDARLPTTMDLKILTAASFNGSVATTNNSRSVFNGGFVAPPFTNAAGATVTLNQETNMYQAFKTNADFTIAYGGTALDGARGQFDIINTSDASITVTIPASYGVAMGGPFTTFTAVSNSVTQLFWQKRSGSNFVSIAAKEALQNIGPNVAIGQVIKVHQVVPSLILTNATDDTGGGAGGGTNTALFVQTNDVSVANTGTETTILGSGVGSKTLAANYLFPGRNIRGTLRGTYSDDIATPGTVRIRVKLGSTTVLDTTAQTPASGVTDDYFEVHFDITCRTMGASGTVWAQGMVELSDGLITTHHLLQMINSAPAVIDTTASQVMDVTWQWGTADSDNSMTNHMAVIVEGPGVTIGTDGTVTSVASGAGLSGGPITTTGTLAVDTTELNDQTWGDNSDATIQWTFNGSTGTDPVLQIGNGLFNLSTGTLQQGGVGVVTTARALTVAGTANQISSSAGAQDLSADRTVTLSLPNNLIAPQSFTVTGASTNGSSVTNVGPTDLGGSLRTLGASTNLGTTRLVGAVTALSTLSQSLGTDGSTAITVLNTDTDATAATTLLRLGHNDSADSDVTYAIFAADESGAPVVDYSFGQTLFTVASGISSTFNGPTAVPTVSTGDADTSAASTDFVRNTLVASNYVKNVQLIQDSITVPMGAWFTNNLLGAHPSGASSLSFSNVSDSFEFSSVQTVTNGIRLLCALPISWDAGVIRVGMRALCTGTNDPSATNVVWSVRAAAIKDGEDASNPTWGTAISVTNRISTGAFTNRHCITRDITVGNSPAATNTIAFEISRLTADAGDTMTNSSVRMIETRIFYKRTSDAVWPVASQ